VYIN
jgi:hypothetical protein